MKYPFTGFTSGFLGFLLLFLMTSVIQVRRTKKISTGTGGNKLLEYRMRAHGNFTETVPIGLFLLYLIESQHLASNSVYMVVSILLILGRILHAYCFLFQNGDSQLRPAGMSFTMSSILVSSSVLIWTAIF
jgi:uncharacterized membrane protein YecN with MAPEG domain